MRFWGKIARITTLSLIASSSLVLIGSSVMLGLGTNWTYNIKQPNKNKKQHTLSEQSIAHPLLAVEPAVIDSSTTNLNLNDLKVGSSQNGLAAANKDDSIAISTNSIDLNLIYGETFFSLDLTNLKFKDLNPTNISISSLDSNLVVNKNVISNINAINASQTTYKLKAAFSINSINYECDFSLTVNLIYINKAESTLSNSDLKSSNISNKLAYEPNNDVTIESNNKIAISLIDNQTFFSLNLSKIAFYNSPSVEYTIIKNTSMFTLQTINNEIILANTSSLAEAKTSILLNVKNSTSKQEITNITINVYRDPENTFIDLKKSKCDLSDLKVRNENNNLNNDFSFVNDVKLYKNKNNSEIEIVLDQNQTFFSLDISKLYFENLGMDAKIKYDISPSQRLTINNYNVIANEVPIDSDTTFEITALIEWQSISVIYQAKSNISISVIKKNSNIDYNKYFNLGFKYGCGTNNFNSIWDSKDNQKKLTINMSYQAFVDNVKKQMQLLEKNNTKKQLESNYYYQYLSNVLLANNLMIAGAVLVSISSVLLIVSIVLFLINLKIKTYL